VAQAIADVARRSKVIHYWSGDPVECHRYWFQWAPPYYTGVKATMDYAMQKNPDGRRWYMLTSDYAFGWTLEELEEEIAQEHDIEFVGRSRHVLGEREFSRYMGEIMAAQPDVLVLFLLEFFEYGTRQTPAPVSRSSSGYLNTAAGSILLIAGIVLLPSMLSLSLAIDIVILAIAATAFNLLLGYTGLLSFGQAAFFAIGGYAAGNALLHLQVGALNALGAVIYTWLADQVIVTRA
jgi:hypothetical protein